jgi:putative DNA primase/helicase
MRGTLPAANRQGRNNEQHRNYNHGDAINQFKSAILDAGITPPENIIADGLLHRSKDSNGKVNIAYILHINGRPAGYFQDFKQGIRQTWKASSNFIPLSEFQRQAFRQQCQREAAQRQCEELAKHEAAAKKAVYICSPAPYATPQQPYLIRKKIGPHGAKLGRGNSLIIPLYNASGELVNLQFISEDGGKRFLSGGLKKGCFFTLGEVTETILICEGFATGASLFEDCGRHTVIAFDAGNLIHVAQGIRAKNPNAEIIICGDNDLSGVGQKKAFEAALAIGGKYIIPATPGHDWNDSLNMEVEQ